MSCEHALNFDQSKAFSKTISQWQFDYGLFTNLPKINVAHDLSLSSFKLKRGILPPLTKYVFYFEKYLSYQDKVSCELNS